METMSVDLRFDHKIIWGRSWYKHNVRDFYFENVFSLQSQSRFETYMRLIERSSATLGLIDFERLPVPHRTLIL